MKYDYFTTEHYTKKFKNAKTMEELGLPIRPPCRTFRTNLWGEKETKQSIRDTKNYRILSKMWSEALDRIRK